MNDAREDDQRRPAGGEPDDVLLVERSRRGDHAAYALLVDRYTHLLMRVTLRLLRDQAQAEDACQEAFLRAYIHLDTYNPAYRFSTWLGAIATHYCLRLLARRDWDRLTLDPAMLAEVILQEGPEASVLRDEQDRSLRSVVAGLPARYRQALILRHWHDLSYAEIATVTGQSLSAVKTQLHRAREMVAQALTAPEGAHAIN